VKYWCGVYSPAGGWLNLGGAIRDMVNFAEEFFPDFFDFLEQVDACLTAAELIGAGAAIAAAGAASDQGWIEAGGWGMVIWGIDEARRNNCTGGIG
jgi:hypothetical protein